MIEIKNLTKKYGSHTAVDNISLTVEKGQIYGFLGPNGAGKSTIMNIITGYIAMTDGQVLIDGHDILEEPETAKKYIGYLPELPPLYMDMNAEEYLNFAAELKGINKSERQKQIQEVMKMTGIADVRHRIMKNLSKGYKQRVGLAQAILGYPEIIILDEPTVGLDPKQIIEIRDLIRSLGEKHTVILSSHILSEISAVCDYVMIISKGKLVASDTPENLSTIMAGSNSLSLTVHGSKGKIESALSDIAEITSFKITASQEDGALNVSVESSKEHDIREKVFYAMSKADLPILHMVSTTMSLEDIFLELTSDSHEAEGEAEATPDEKDTKAETEKSGISESPDITEIKNHDEKEDAADDDSNL